MAKKYCTVVKQSGSSSINLVTKSGSCRLDSVTVHFGSTPGGSGDLTVTLKSIGGSVYDTVLYRVKPGTGGTTDIVFIPDAQFSLEEGDTIELSYANLSSVDFGARIVTQGL